MRSATRPILLLLPVLLGLASLACSLTVTPQPIPEADGATMSKDGGASDMGIRADGLYKLADAGGGPDGVSIPDDLGPRDGEPETCPVCKDGPCAEGPPVPPEAGADEAGADEAGADEAGCGDLIILQPDL